LHRVKISINMEIPLALKSIKPYIKRAEELDNDRSRPASRIVAYYCRQYALELAIPLLKETKDAKAQECAMNIMNSLEEEKKAVGEAFSKNESYSIIRDFATSVLEGGDKHYDSIYSANARNYGAAKVVARTYYAAGCFFDVLSIFEQSNVDEAVLELEGNTMKRKYCKWRASEILKAVKNGSDLPEPVKEDGEEDEAKGDEEKEEDLSPAAPAAPPAAPSSPPQSKEAEDPFGIPEAPSSTPSTVAESKISPPDYDDVPPPVFKPSAPAPSPAPAPAPAPAKTGWFGSKKSSSTTSKESIADAIELSKFAIAALEGKEIDIAKQRLQQALACLK